MSDSLIRDIPRLKKLLEDAKNLKALKTMSPLTVPLLRLFGIDGSQIKEALADVDNLDRIAEELATIPDLFNDQFATRGWIIYDLMNLEVAKAAIIKAQAGDIDVAEVDLRDYYSPETVEWKLQTMMGVEAFRQRMPLAEKALTDYREGRYHACVPVVLALLDGMVNELHEKRRGFFAEDVDLKAWDSIAAHDKGLNALVKIFQTGRYKTTAETITIPYRNGILHGMDLGYDNRMVAAKSWAALFATRDWAIRVEQGLLKAPADKPKTTWRDLIQQIHENNEDKVRLADWKPRALVIGEDVPRTGDLSMFADGSPEQRLAEFLSYWKVRNYGRMAQQLPSMFGGSIQKIAGQVREIYGSKRLEEFEFQEIKDEAPAITNIEVKLSYEEDGNPIERVVVARLLSEDAKGNPAVRGKSNSVWRIVNWGLV